MEQLFRKESEMDGIARP